MLVRPEGAEGRGAYEVSEVMIYVQGDQGTRKKGSIVAKWVYTCG